MLSPDEKCPGWATWPGTSRSSPRNSESSPISCKGYNYVVFQLFLGGFLELMNSKKCGVEVNCIIPNVKSIKVHAFYQNDKVLDEEKLKRKS